MWRENNGAVKRKAAIFIPAILFTIIILLFFDTRLWLTARDLISPDFYFIAQLITDWGLYIFYAIFVALFVYSFIGKNRKLTGLCLAYLKAQLIVSFAVVRILKIVLGRARPDHGADFTFFSLNSRYNSFPSGHAADAFVSGVFLYLLLKQTKYTDYRFLPLIYAFLIAVSRVFVSAHYPSDVAAGMAIGILGAWFFVSRLSNPEKAEKWPPRHKDTKQNCL
jgi:membrane-associated phospholipid phosphatase